MRVLLCVLWSLASLVSWSQTVTYDTIVEVKEVEIGVFDTIYYVKKHVQLNRELVVVDTVRGNQWAIDTYGGTPLLSNKARYTEGDLTFNASETSGYYLGASVYYNFPKKWSVRVGAKLDHQKITANYTRTTSYDIDVPEEVNDTLDTYFTIDGLDTTYFHIIETKVTERTIQKTDYSDLDYDWKLYFIKIPIQLSYTLELNRWNFSFLAGTNLNFQFKQFKSNSRDRKENIASMSASGIVSLQAGYFIGNSTLIQIQPFYENSFNKSGNSLIPSNQIYIGFGIKQFF